MMGAGMRERDGSFEGSAYGGRKFKVGIGLGCDSSVCPVSSSPSLN